MASSHSPEAPFLATAALSLEKLNEPGSHIPGQPTVPLDQAIVDAFLAQELNTPVLDELYPRLWCVARKSGASIHPLHLQKAKGRDIVPTENPQLHLIWYHDKIYVKPIPECLLNHDFWTAYLSSSMGNEPPRAKGSPKGEKVFNPTFDRSIALGFLRSYAHLIQHRSDFTLAREHQLVPDNVDWIKWSQFIHHFRHIEDAQIANRYHYGQMRLSRLNWAVRLFRPRSASIVWFYEIPYWSTELYVQRAIAPLIFGFASISLVLSSMQVVLAAPADELGFGLLGASGVQAMKRAFWVFSIITLFLSGFVWILLFLIPLSVLAWQLSWGYKNRGKEIVSRPMVV
jgi:hypothetical protein